MLPKYKSCSFCPKLPSENNNRQWREQKEEVKKNSIWSIELNFMQPCNFTHWSTRSCSCTCDWHPLNGSLPLLLQNSPENSAYTVKFVFRFLLPKLIKTNWLVFERKNSNEIWKLKFEFDVKIDNARYARMTLFWGIWNHRTRNFYSDINRHSSIPHHGNFEFSYWLSWVERRVTRWHASLLAWWKAK